MYSRSYTPIRIQATSSYPPLIAAWWTDIYPNVGGSNFYYRAYTSGSILQRAANDILRFSGRTSFSPTWMMVATWHNSPLYCCQREERVTVQAVLVTDSVSTYVMFNYIDVNIPVKRHNIAIGWFNNVTSYSHSLSFTNSAYSMSKQAGNRDVNECLTDPCQNNATCENFYGGFKCHCIPGTDGTYCDGDIDECLSFPCKNGATCINTPGSFICNCVENYGGFLCGTEIQNITYRNGTTNIYAACEAVQDILEVKDNSAQYVYLLTDGMPTDLSMAGEGISILRQYLSNSSSFNEVFIIAFGEDVRHEGLRKLSVDPYFYSDIYDPINMDPYYKMIKRLISPHCSACTATLTDRADVVILIDKSTQFDQQLYNQQLNAVMNTTRLLNTMVIGRENIQVGAVAFSNAVSHIMWLNETQDIITLNRRIGSVQQDKVNSSSRRGEALEYVRTKYLDIAKGAREDNIRKFVIHFDCGFDEDTSKTRKEIQALMNRTNVIVVSVGVGPHFVEDTLLSSASSPFYSFFSDVLLPDEDLLIMFKNTRYISCTSRIRS
ncbi:hypothetical protein FSP39_005908 [Pinctada imbricata]|uniref:Uncharacterized protein n=1 Tax=Pinctada imbricata TaxID=66713 RepID=A0AA88XV87_PINIB|nr:hypothetical protein FSP39_005908 [Pinctada imbricata]